MNHVIKTRIEWRFETLLLLSVSLQKFQDRFTSSIRLVYVAPSIQKNSNTFNKIWSNHWNIIFIRVVPGIREPIFKIVFRQQTVKGDVAVCVDGVGICSGFQKQSDDLLVIGLFLLNNIKKIASSMEEIWLVCFPFFVDVDVTCKILLESFAVLETHLG